MTDKLKEEINAIQGRAAAVKIDSQIMNRFSTYIQVSAFLISKGEIDRAESWLHIALDSGMEPSIFDDLKDSDGNKKDIDSWVSKQLNGEICFEKSVDLIRNKFPEIEKLRTA
ncbi:hypothetical protein [Proteus penneri]|uniref:hypothetical protein n=1 Tax=Proteus penneri TaxID=102862 RepID=UPI00288925BD|nr:hypothetical protein [Proteus penneri]